MPDSEYDELWRNPAHWTALGFYRCADDPRIWVARRAPSIGWTVNLAHRRGRLSLALLLAGTLVPALAAVVLDARDAPTLWGILVIAPFVFSIVFLIALHARSR